MLLKSAVNAVAASKFQDMFLFFVQFDTRDLEIFVICWIESVDPVDDLCLTNQIYSLLLSMLLNSKKSLKFTLLEDDETRPRGCRMITTRQHLARLLKYYPRKP